MIKTRCKQENKTNKKCGRKYNIEERLEIQPGRIRIVYAYLKTNTNYQDCLGD